jgi:type IX secretion system PorP/SprF family membrane protein
MNYKYLIIYFLILSLQLSAQDPHFSQFFASPLTINPANTGNFTGIIRVASNIKNQLPDFNNAYTTKTVSLDAPILKKNIPKKDKLSLGMLFLSDQSGNRLLNNNHLALSVSYNKALDKKGENAIIAGFQINYGKYQFDLTRANFEDQLTSGGFTNSTSDFLIGNSFTKSNTDINAGLLYLGSFGDENRFYIGTSYYHILRPTIGFSTSSDILNSRYNIHGATYISLSYSTSLHSNFQFQKQGESNEFLLGSAISRYFGNKNGYEIYAGLWYRNKESLIPYLGLEWANIRAGFTYDMGVFSKTTSTNMFQSNELSLIYVLNIYNGEPFFKCPKF